jgi:hypothetical protein
VDVCPQGAINLSVENQQFVDDAIAHISTLVELA